MYDFLRKQLSHIPLPPWLYRCYHIVRTLTSEINQTNLMLHAASMSYISLGSLIPSLAVTFAIIAAFQPLTDPGADWFGEFRTFILTNLTPEAGEDMVVFLESFLVNVDVTRIGVTGFVFLFMILVLLLRNIEVALNAIWEVSDSRPLFKRFLYFWITITLGALGLSVIISIFTQLNVGEWLPFLQRETGVTSKTVSNAATLFITFVFFSVLHKIGPNCYVSFKAAVAGGLAATIMIRLASQGYAVYLRHSDWNENIYEALAVVPLFLLWLYIGWLVLLFSASIGWRVQHGFSIKRSPELSSKLQTADCEVQTRNTQLRALLPTICILLTAYRFHEASGKKVTGHDIANNLDIPLAWVREAIIIAEKRGMLVIERPHDQADNEAEDILELGLFPVYPLEKLSIADLLERLSADTLLWLASRHINLPLNLQTLMNVIYTNMKNNNGKASLATILSEAQRTSSSQP